MTGDVRVPGFLGRVLVDGGEPVGTCFQVSPGLLVTAWHVLVDAGAEQVGAVVQVDGLPAGGVPAVRATVERVDALHDLAVLRRDVPLPDSVGRIVGSDEQLLGAAVVVTGHCVVAERSGVVTRYLDAPGVWAGGTMREDQVPLGRLSAGDVLPGMSGAPVRRGSDGAVVGVVSARYNTSDGWLRDTVWIARTENLQVLLAGVPGADLATMLIREPLTAPAELVLTVDATSVRLSGGGLDVTAAHGGVRPGLAGALADVRQARARAGTARAEPAVAPGPPGAEPGPTGAAVSMRRAGELLAQSFLPAPLSDQLRTLMGRAEAASMPVRIGVQAVGVLSQLPWEALPDPLSGVPLALHRLVTVYRRAPSAAAVRVLPGPLRIVVAIAAPTSGGGGVLDYERELRSVLSAVRGARAGDAQVQIVPFATTGAIRRALADGDVHVLHLSGHGAPGRLVLENEDGSARLVDAGQFLAEAVPAGCMPPVLALAACYTSASGEGQAPSLAAELVAAGAPVVIGTETSVTDRYATRLFARVYAELAQAPVPDVVGAVGLARRVVQDELIGSTDRRDQALAAMDEWGVVTVLAGQGHCQVLDTTWQPKATPQRMGGRRTVAGLSGREPGEFVGRRAEQRVLPAVLCGEPISGVSEHGVLLHGIGGVGKTTLAAEVIRRVQERDPARRVATVTGAATVDGVFGAVAAALRGPLLMAGTASGDTLQALAVIERPDLPWQDRWQVLAEYLLDDTPLLLVLDNFEDNLTDVKGGTTGAVGVGVPGLQELRDGPLANLLAAWVAAPGRSRLLVTCRYRFNLPGDAQHSLRIRQVGPLSEAETLKLVWALPRLDALDDADVQQVWRYVGGHPRTLEYLDALLAGGQGRFPDLTARLAKQVQARLGIGAQQWLGSERTLDAAVADAVTVAADDVLLPELLASIAGVPAAEPALLGLSVYRTPVDLPALQFQIGTVDETAGWQADRQKAEREILAAANMHNVEVADLNAALQAGDLSALPVELVAQLQPALAEMSALPRPPRSTDVELWQIVQALAGASLLAVDDDSGALFVHRWTASELTRRWALAGRGSELTVAHRNAAAYWQWRVDVWPQDRHADINDLLETRHHLLAAGDHDAAVALTEGICAQLDQWGALDQETALIHSTLALLPEQDDRRSPWLHQLGILAQLRGDYEEAERRYRQSLEISERLGDQAGAAIGYHQLGMLAQLRGDYEEAERRYRQSLEIKERLGDQAGAASTLSQTGLLQSASGRPDAAVLPHVRALSIRLGLGAHQAQIDIRALQRLRTQLGDAPLIETLRNVLDETSQANLMTLLDDQEPPASPV